MDRATRVGINVLGKGIYLLFVVVLAETKLPVACDREEFDFNDNCKAILPPPIREVVVAPFGRATWLEARDALLTVAGQRRTFTGFAFEPLIREGWHPKGLFNCLDCICGRVECQEQTGQMTQPGRAEVAKSDGTAWVGPILRHQTAAKIIPMTVTSNPTHTSQGR